jgi:sugar/nucleoside kinase (ribokinase family)
VVGDLVTDVLVVTTGALAVGSDTTGTVRFTGGGQAANTAAWLAHAWHSRQEQVTGSPRRPGTDQAHQDQASGAHAGLGTGQGRREHPAAPPSVTLVAAIGDDDAGRARTAELARDGVTCAVTVHAGAATGSVVVLAADGERTMVADRGANLLLAPADVTAAIAAAKAPPTPAGAAAPSPRTGVHVHLSGYPLLDDRTRPAGLAALAAARVCGATTSVDAASAAPLAVLGADQFLALVRDVDLLLANADEADVLAGPGPAERQAARLCRFARNVVVKRGAAGALWCGRDGVTAVVAAERVHPHDPTGAGDAFAAGLLAAWCAGASPADALAAGVALGAEAVRAVGARPPGRAESDPGSAPVDPD